VTVVYDGELDSVDCDGVEFIERGSFSPEHATSDRFHAAVVPPLVAMVMPGLLESNIPIVVDLFDPVVWENLELYRAESDKEKIFQHERHLAALVAGLFRGDFFIVAGHRQQDLFLGALMALNRINPGTWPHGRGAGQMVGLVPFGLPDEDPPSSNELPVPSGYGVDGPLVVWGGGMWDWLSPDTMVRAMPRILDKYPSAALAFPGTRHPNPHVPDPGMVGLVKDLAKRTGVINSIIFGGWLPRMDYLGLLAHAACAVSAHSDGLESRYAVRTRFLDAIWMGTPQVVSGGDEYSDYVSENNLGIVVPSDDPHDFANAVINVIESGRGRYAADFEHARNELKWSRMAIPLIDWLKDPRVTHGTGVEFFRSTIGEASPKSRPADLASLMKRVLTRLKG
jgi:hypothetical protein